MGAALERERLTETAAVSHDLRDPLSIAPASVTTLDSTPGGGLTMVLTPSTAEPA